MNTESIPFINIHSHREGRPKDITLRSYRLGIDLPPSPGVFYSCGIHPWDVDKGMDYPALLKHLREAPMSALGEIGLDFATNINIQLQKKYLELQIAIAAERNLPVIIHCVKAFQDVMTMLKGFSQPVILHGWIGSPEMTDDVIERNMYVSLSRRSLESPKTVSGLLGLPFDDRLFLETDDSSDSIEDVYIIASEKFGIPVEQLQFMIYNNYKNMFGKQ